MSTEGRGFARNASAAVWATALVQLLGGLAALLLPRLISGDDYGWWQLYYLFVGFAGVLHLGWADGHYLRVGGRDFGGLDAAAETAQLRLLALFDLILCLLLALAAQAFAAESARRAVWFWALASAVFICPRDYILGTLQATNRIRAYAGLTVLEKLLSTAATLLLPLLGVKGVLPLLAADAGAKLVTLIAALALCGGTFSARPLPLPAAGREARAYIAAGFPLMLATLLAMLVTGAARLVIQGRWDIAAYGRAALAVSLAGLALKLVSSASAAVFPFLRRMEPERIPALYRSASFASLALVACALVLYAPAAALLTRFLPAYAESFRYAVLLLPICVFGSRFSLLITPCLNALGRTRTLLAVNAAGAAAACLTALAAAWAFDSIPLTLCSAGIGLAVCCALGEVSLARSLGTRPGTAILETCALAAAFSLLLWFLGWTGAALYLLAVLVWLFLRRDDCRALTAQARALRRTRG